MNTPPSDHARHDAFLVAALVGDDLTGAVRSEAEALVAACTDCASLLADLRDIAAATAALPVIAAPRDFRLTEADAARLRPRRWRRWVAAFGDARLAFTRPLAVGLTTLGIIGLVAGNVGNPLAGGSNPVTAGSGSSETSGAFQVPQVDQVASAAPAAVEASKVPSNPANTDRFGVASPAASGRREPVGATVGSAPPGPVGGPVGVGGPVASAKAPDGSGRVASAPSPAAAYKASSAPDRTPAAIGSSVLTLASLGLLVAGLALLALRLGARRLA